jgi:hypothetical protein
VSPVVNSALVATADACSPGRAASLGKRMQAKGHNMLAPLSLLQQGSEEIGGLARLALYHVFERQTRPTLPVAAPMSQHVGRRACVDYHRDMRAAVAEPEQCAWVDQHLADWLVIVPSVAGHRKK